MQALQSAFAFFLTYQLIFLTQSFINSTMSRFIALIPAAGSGSRMGNELPKQYLSLNNKPMIYHAINTLCHSQLIARILVVLAPNDNEWFHYDWSEFSEKLIVLNCGGITRAESVLNGLTAAKQKAEELGYTVLVQDELVTGETAEAAKLIIEKAKKYQSNKPACLLFGGETTVTVTGNGKGGRNQHLALCALSYLTNDTNITLLAAGTDGTDGPTDAAGAFADHNLIKAADQQKRSISDAINDNDAYHFFENVNGLLKTGATQTNVMDIIVVLID